MGFKLGKAKELTSGGEAFVEKDLITDDNHCIMTHKNVEERGVDLQVDQTLMLETPQPVKTFQNIDPSWLVNVSSDRRITSITFEAWTATPTTDAVLIIRRAGESFYQKFLGVITAGAETTFDLTGADFVPIDLIDATAYTFTIVSQSGLQIELIGDFPNLPFYKWEYHDLTTQELAYVSDLTATDGIFHVDLNTTVPSADRDGSIFRPFISITEGLAAVGSASVSDQHTFIMATGNYNEIVSLPVFTHFQSLGADSQSVQINTVNVTDEGGESSIQNIRANNIDYDTSGAAGILNRVLVLSNCDSNGGISAIGRGAGVDSLLVTGFSNVDDFSPITDMYLRITNAYPLIFTGVLNANSTAAGVNLRNGVSSLTELNNVDFSNAINFSLGAAGSTDARIELTDAKIPTILTNITAGNSGTIAYDSLSKPASIVNSTDPAIIELLSKADSVEYDDTGRSFSADTVQEAIDEIDEVISVIEAAKFASFDTDFAWASVASVTVPSGVWRSTSNDVFITLTSPIVADITVTGAGGLQTGSAEASDTWYGVHVISDTSDSNAPDVLLIPDGTAFSEAGYDEERLIGWVRNDATSDFVKFYCDGTGRYQKYMYDADEEHLLINQGSATAFTTVDCSEGLPPTSTWGIFQFGVLQAAASSSLFMRPGGGTGNSDEHRIRQGSSTTFSMRVHGTMMTNTDQEIEYEVSTAADDAFISIRGFEVQI